MINNKVVYPSILEIISYFTTHLSLSLQVKEFFLNWWTFGEVTDKMVIVHAPHSHCIFVLKDVDLAR